MNVLLLMAHAVAEYDDLKLFAELGYDVFCPGGYEVPSQPGEAMRPALPLVPHHPDLVEACRQQRAQYAETHPEMTEYAIDWAKKVIPQAVLDWADTIICHHFPQRWLAEQWPRIRDKRVLWRTCGQSHPELERNMSRLVADGLQVVRYSPAEKRAFTRLGAFAGEDVLIRFYKDPDEWNGWTGDWEKVTNVTQNLMQRGDYTNGRFWIEATAGLPTLPVGEGSKVIGGPGKVTFEWMQLALRQCRAYLYTGTQPASYTLGLIEAMMTGIPVVSIGPSWMAIPDLFEGHELAPLASNRVEDARVHLKAIMADRGYAEALSKSGRSEAIELFGRETITKQWLSFLGSPVRVGPEAVTAA